tara:strand:- start:223 stop:498 length:276 start_codon:yes stop_codon:yes gene_type:complete
MYKINITSADDSNYAHSLPNGRVVVSYNSNNEFSISKITLNLDVYEAIVDYLVDEGFVKNRDDSDIPREILGEACLSFGRIKGLNKTIWLD